MNTLGSFEVNKVEIYLYCIFNGENYLDLMKFFPEEEVVELWKKQGKRYVKIDNFTFCEGDVILGKVGHYGWQKKTIEELQEMIDDNALLDIEREVIRLKENNRYLRNKFAEIEAENNRLNEELNTEQAHAGDLWDELIDLKNGYDPKIEMPDNDVVVLIQLAQDGQILRAVRSHGENIWRTCEGYGKVDKFYNQLVIRWWHLPKYETDN